MNDRLPALYDEIEPIALHISERAVAMRPADAQRAYLISVAQAILDDGRYRREHGTASSAEALEATLTWFEILNDELEPYITGERTAAELIKRGGGRLWVAFQAREPICAAWANGVARSLEGRLADQRVLELGVGTGGTTRRLATALRDCRAFVASDIKQVFLDRVIPDLPGVPVTATLVDIDQLDPSVGTFDLIYATNCLHVSKDVMAALAGLRQLLEPGGTLVLGEGAHYSRTTPSPLSLILSLFDGWWDAPTSETRPQAGFLQPEQWLSALVEAGFSEPYAETWRDDRRQFGGVYWAQGPQAAG